MHDFWKEGFTLKDQRKTFCHYTELYRTTDGPEKRNSMSFFYFPFSILNFMLYADLCNMYRFCILVLTTGGINRDVTTLRAFSVAPGPASVLRLAGQ